MATIATLTTQLVVDHGRFTKGMRKAASETSRFSAAVKFGVGSLAKLATPLIAATAAAISFHKAFSLINDQFSEVDRLQKFGRATGIAVNELVAYEHAAGLAGASTEDVTTALSRMVRTLGQIDAGIGEQVTNLGRLGFAFESIEGLSPGRAFEEIADQIKSIEDPARRAAIAQEFFGRGAQKIMNLLLSGSTGFKAARKEVEKMGLTFDDLSGRRLEQAKDATFRLEQAFKGMARTAIIELAPLVEFLSQDLARNISEITKSLRGMVSEGSKLRTVGEAFGLLQDIGGVIGGTKGLSGEHLFSNARAAKAFFDDLENGLSKVGSATSGPLGDAAEGFLKMQEAIEGVMKSLQGGGTGGMSLDETLSTVHAQLFNLGASIPQINKAFEQIRQNFTDAANTDINSFIENMRRQLRTLQKQTELGRPLTSNEQTLLNFKNKDLVDPNAITVADRLISGIERQQKAFDDAQASTESFRAAIDATNSSIEKMQQQLAGEAKSIFEQTRTPMEKLEMQLRRLDELFLSGAFKQFGGEDTFNRARRDLLKDFDPLRRFFGRQTQSAQLPRALERGSSAAFSAVARFERGGTGGSVEERILKVNVDQLRVLQAIQGGPGGLLAVAELN